MSSRYEFLGSLSFGHYIPRPSWFHRRDPRARLVVFICLFFGIVFTSHLWAIGLGLALVFGVYALASLPLKPAWRGIRRSIIFILLLALLQIFLFRAGDPGATIWVVFGLPITTNAVLSAAILVAKFIVLILLINALVMSLSTSQITTALFYMLKPFEKIGFPVNDLILVVQVTLRYLPLIAQTAEKTAKAQASRGGDWEQKGFNPLRQAKRVLPMIVPLIVTSLKRAETMALAMESRGFNAAEERSSYYELNFNGEDAILVALGILASTLLLVPGWIA
ncbi:MAG: energy-coupling factor transporter transmembrane protein EcfT [Anaerolineaceae bacterium]|jgi:energy-coupling factor transport system permease protein|nr:energy-coupling factor transporter transmembrane protein EcfT [Anaerolineaceae bacterium]